MDQLIQNQSHCEGLCDIEKKELEKEIALFIQYVSIDLLSKYTSSTDIENMFHAMTTRVQENCPILFEIINIFLLQKKDGRNVSEKRVMSATHALAILVSLKSQKIPNDFKIMFTLLCISFGGGSRFVGMMNHLGLTVSWQKAMHVFEGQKKKMEENIKSITPAQIPLILLMDNINMYRGKRKHLRLYKSFGPTMWNFTVRAMMIPNTDGLEHILCDKEACLSSQSSAIEMEPEDIFLEKHPEKVDLFSAAVDRYLSELLHVALNTVALTTEVLKEMNESQLNSHLLKIGNNIENPCEYKIEIAKEEEVVKTSCNIRSNVHMLPLSLEDNSTVFGTMTILNDFSKQFNLPSQTKAEYLPFDLFTGNFNIVSARNHFELLLSQQNHVQRRKNNELQLRSTEKSLEEVTDIFSDDECDSESERLDEGDGIGFDSVTIENERRRFEKLDQSFWDVYNMIQQEVNIVLSRNSEEEYISSVNNPKTKRSVAIRDHLQRSVLHVAVEQTEVSLVKFLINIGLDVNAREGCGATPLTLAVLTKNTLICTFLVEAGAKHSGPLFTSIPSPLVMATKLELNDILAMFNEDSALSDEEDMFIKRLDETLCKSPESGQTQFPSNEETCNRTSPGFVTPVVGDVGTCKTNNAAMSRSGSHQWVDLCPGDLHNKGYFCEAVFKVHGSSGFHVMLVEVLKRKRLMTEVFKRKKFNEANLTKVREAINDACRSYGIAAAIEFCSSNCFPSNEQLEEDNNGVLLLTKFKEWLQSSSEADVAFNHRATAFLFYGPLQQLYDMATRHGDGIAHEAVYQAQVPMYAQLGFCNYYTEVFRHTVNFLAKWPSATRLLLQQNCCVNILGKKSHGVELDAYVESEVVRPLKNYASQHTTVDMCEKLMANLDLLKCVRRAYMSKQGFDVHHSSLHSVQSSLLDQIKGAWFCIQKEFFKCKE